MNVTSGLKAELWKRFGSPQFPAEWDGQVYGGGKLSQRLWEYNEAIELMNLNKDSVVLDIGGGTPETGLGYYASILITKVKKIIVVDPTVKNAKSDLPNVVLVPELATYDSLKKVFNDHPDITHVTSISVFEHVPLAARSEITRAINDFFKG